MRRREIPTYYLGRLAGSVHGLWYDGSGWVHARHPDARKYPDLESARIAAFELAAKLTILGEYEGSIVVVEPDPTTVRHYYHEAV